MIKRGGSPFILFICCVCEVFDWLSVLLLAISRSISWLPYDVLSFFLLLLYNIRAWTIGMKLVDKRDIEYRLCIRSEKCCLCYYKNYNQRYKQ